MASLWASAHCTDELVHGDAVLRDERLALSTIDSLGQRLHMLDHFSNVGSIQPAERLDDLRLGVLHGTPWYALRGPSLGRRHQRLPGTRPDGLSARESALAWRHLSVGAIRYAVARADRLFEQSVSTIGTWTIGRPAGDEAKIT